MPAPAPIRHWWSGLRAVKAVSVTATSRQSITFVMVDRTHDEINRRALDMLSRYYGDHPYRLDSIDVAPAVRSAEQLGHEPRALDGMWQATVCASTVVLS